MNIVWNGRRAVGTVRRARPGQAVHMGGLCWQKWDSELQQDVPVT